jgi:hypothetical protein
MPDEFVVFGSSKGARIRKLTKKEKKAGLLKADKKTDRGIRKEPMKDPLIWLTVLPLCEFCGRTLKEDDFYLLMNPKKSWFFCSRECLRGWR